MSYCIHDDAEDWYGYVYTGADDRPGEVGSTVVKAEQKHIGRVEIEFCPSAQRRDVLEGDSLPTKRSTLS